MRVTDEKLICREGIRLRAGQILEKVRSALAENTPPIPQALSRNPVVSAVGRTGDLEDRAVSAAGEIRVRWWGRYSGR